MKSFKRKLSINQVLAIALMFFLCMVLSDGLFAQNVAITDDDGKYNSFIGYQSGMGNTVGKYNSFMGYQAGMENINGEANVFIGYVAGKLNSSGIHNIGIGYAAGLNNISGDYNVFLGAYAGYNVETGSGNVFIGYQTGYSETGSNKLYIDNSNTGSPLIYGDFSSNVLTINGGLNLKDGTGAGNLSIYEPSSSGSNKVTILSQPIATDYTLTLPVDDGTWIDCCRGRSNLSMLPGF